MPQTFTSFKDLAAHLHQKDIEAANKLRKSASLRKGKNTLAVVRPK